MPWSSSSPSGLFTWIKDAGQFSDVGGTVPCNDGDALDVWADQKNSNNGTLLGGGYTPPTFHTSLQNSLPGVTFNGVGDALKIPNLLTGSKSHHVFIVIKQDTLVNAYSSVFGYGVTPTNGGAIFIKSNGKSAWYIPNSFGSSYYSYDGTGAKTYIAGTAYIIEAKCDQVGGLASLYQNGDLDASVPITGTIDGGDINDGHIIGGYAASGSQWPGSILEELPYQGVLSNSDRNLAGKYLADKWGISTSYTSGGGGSSARVNVISPALDGFLVFGLDGGGLLPVDSYTFAGPSFGTVGVPSGDFTATLGTGTLSGSVTITPDDSSGGGSFSPTTNVLTDSSRSGSFAYTAGSVGTKTIATTNDGALTDPVSLSYEAFDQPSPPSGGTGTVVIGLGIAGIF